MARLHLHQPTTVWMRRVAYCPVCEKRRRMIGALQIWYATTWTCCGCGDSFTDGFRDPRPFTRNWRELSISAAKRRWDEAGPKAEAEAAWRALLESEFGDVKEPKEEKIKL